MRPVRADAGNVRDQMSLRPEHRGLEIAATWLVPSMWRTGANVEAKLLMLGQAFERRLTAARMRPAAGG
jgi:RimJ/RimL family protein N-acetyltransferase